MTEAELRPMVVAALHRACGLLNDPRFAGAAADPAADIAFTDLDFDSLAALELCLGLEDTAGIEIDPGDLLAYPTVNALSAALAEQKVGRPSAGHA